MKKIILILLIAATAGFIFFSLRDNDPSTEVIVQDSTTPSVQELNQNTTSESLQESFDKEAARLGKESLVVNTTKKPTVIFQKNESNNNPETSQVIVSVFPNGITSIDATEMTIFYDPSVTTITDYEGTQLFPDTTHHTTEEGLISLYAKNINNADINQPIVAVAKISYTGDFTFKLVGPESFLVSNDIIFGLEQQEN